MKQILLITCFLLTSFSSFSQYIEGKVLDAETNKPIEGVHVIVKGINRGALTNAKGNFYIKFPYKIIESDIIKFSHLRGSLYSKEKELFGVLATRYYKT